MTNGHRYWGTDTGNQDHPVDGQSFAYNYDNIGNRMTSTKNEEQGTYSANSLNQYTQRTIPDGIDILGSAETNTTVTVNDEPVSRHDKYWYKALTVTNGSAAAYQEVNVVGVYNPPGTNDPDVVTSETGHVFMAKTPEQFAYDDDGNLLSDGRFNYSWDAENRLIAAETMTNLPASVPLKKIEFAYDYMSRRVSKTVYDWNATSNEWDAVELRENIYDGWNLISEKISNQQSTITNSYAWGLDLSGSLQGAGGIGGLLASHSSDTSNPSAFFAYDANGNVSELIGTNGTVLAHYEYSPFGEMIVATGPLTFVNPFRFSTKYFVDELGIGDWGYRWYIPSLGRFATKDPLGDWSNISIISSSFKIILDTPIDNQEDAISPLEVIALWTDINQNLMQIVRNNPINNIDPSGLCRKQDESYLDCLSRYARDFYGDRAVFYSDLFGYYGAFESLRGLSGMGVDLYAKIMQAVANQRIQNASIAGAEAGGSMLKRMVIAEAAAKEASRMTVSLRMLGGISRILGAVALPGTGISLGMRLAFIPECSSECPNKCNK